MIVKFFRRGKGLGSGPLNYLLGSSKPREGAKVLYGDPRLTEQLINATPYKQKYKSGVLSFTEDAAQFSDEQKKDIMQRFEDTLFIGLEPDQYDILWIEHSDKDGRLELNFVIPCQELRSGKSLQPFYAQADLTRVNAFKNIINKEYGLTDPNEPERKRLINPYINNAPRPTPYDAKQKTKNENDEIIKDPSDIYALKAAIDRKMLESLKKGMLNSRTSVLYLLENLDLKVEKTTKSSISISHPTMKRNVRLKGAVYEEGFKGLEQRPYIIESLQEEYERMSYSRGNRDLIAWTKGMNIKKEYHQSLYSDIKIPEALELGIANTQPDSQPQNTFVKAEVYTSRRSYNPHP